MLCVKDSRNYGQFERFHKNCGLFSLHVRLYGGGSSPERTVLCQIPCNREKYREFRAVSGGTVAIEFAQDAIPEPSFSPSAPVLMENRTGNFNRHNRDSIGQIKEHHA